MRFNEFSKELDESLALAKQSDVKYLPAINELIKSKTPFLIGKGGDEGEFLFDPVELTNPQQLLSGTWIKHNKNPDLEGTKGQIKATKIFKSNAIKAYLAGKSEEEFAAGNKESFKVKPADVLAQYGTFASNRLANYIIKSPVLLKQNIGKYIIDLATQINKGQIADWTNIPKEYQSAISNYAGEYLGVLALLKGTADFPTKEKWLQHLGVDSINSIALDFPSETNFPLGDSIGSFKNTKEGTSIYISSKAGAKGAPPSLDNLKIPEEFAKKKAFKREYEVITALQNENIGAPYGINSAAVAQPFVGINIIHKHAPKSIDPNLSKLLPLSKEDISQIASYINLDYSLNNISGLTFPAKIRALYNFAIKNVASIKNPDRTSVGTLIHYVIAKNLMDAVNVKKALPNFETMAREILQRNFIQIFARPKSGKLNFVVLWPNRDLATGKVTLYNKNSTTGIQQKLSFSVTD